MITRTGVHPPRAAGPERRDLGRSPWIDFDGPAGVGSGRPSLAAVLDERRGPTIWPVRAVARAGSAGLTLLTTSRHGRNGRSLLNPAGRFRTSTGDEHVPITVSRFPAITFRSRT